MIFPCAPADRAAPPAAPAPDACGAELIALVRRAQAGELEAQSELARRYTPGLSGLVRPFLRRSVGAAIGLHAKASATSRPPSRCRAAA